MSATFMVPPEFRETVHSVWPEDGLDWFEKLPALIAHCAEKWELSFVGLPGDLSISYVVFVEHGQTKEPAVLKICKEMSFELEALELFDPSIALKPLKVDIDLGAILLKRLYPGYTLRKVQVQDDIRATEIAAPCLRELPVNLPSDEKFPRVSSWIEQDLISKKDDIATAGKVPVKLFEHAVSLAKELELPPRDQRVLHGDLHHDNFLFDEQRGWVVIDPKGVVGDPAYNCARFLWNPLEVLKLQSDSPKLLKTRVEILASQTGFEQSRIAAWGFIDAMCFACWTNQLSDRDHTLACARELYSICTE